jgi:hypothetical protein
MLILSMGCSMPYGKQKATCPLSRWEVGQYTVTNKQKRLLIYFLSHSFARICEVIWMAAWYYKLLHKRSSILCHSYVRIEYFSCISDFSVHVCPYID